MVLTVSAVGSCVTPFGGLPVVLALLTGRSPQWARLPPRLAWVTSKCLFNVSLL